VHCQAFGNPVREVPTRSIVGTSPTKSLLAPRYSCRLHVSDVQQTDTAVATAAASSAAAVAVA
jgi:hypothetical protein